MNPSSPHLQDRRKFLAATAAAGAAFALPAPARAFGANERLVAAVMGANGRGSDLAEMWARLPNVEIAYVCDPDERAIVKGIAAATNGGQPQAPQGVKDFRRALDDKNVDILICAAPDHWHAAATTLACAAGKHVYVEKPCSYCGAEGEVMVEGARKHDRRVQVGMQRRSSPMYRELIEKIHGGVIGRPLYARCWYNSIRPTIGKGRQTAPPAWLDYDLWQGPAPERTFQDNLVHYNWHFFWHWGTSEIGNNGVHLLDVCRWALGVDFPSRVTGAGGKYRFPDDDQETPDNSTAVFDFGDRSIVWESVSWSASPVDSQFGIEIRGEQGTAITDDEKYTIYDADRKEIGGSIGGQDQSAHIADFIDAIRSERLPHADVLEGHKTAALCHLGNIAYRTGRTLTTNPETGNIVNDPDAVRLWTREYRDLWAPQA